MLSSVALYAGQTQRVLTDSPDCPRLFVRVLLWVHAQVNSLMCGAVAATARATQCWRSAGLVQRHVGPPAVGP